ncbi:hypothetical protein I4F81_004867 [Pyropia yezoensis]|uniref:Uncharacterized protein n=1 Tax=Pyropia yezoensis TaxID=2788 RepID=A0ACC3BXI6_PYRYE|nr:hypothetical protein I4F81_004867 [Neopyropia yezoensis]
MMAPAVGVRCGARGEVGGGATSSTLPLKRLKSRQSATTPPGVHPHRRHRGSDDAAAGARPPAASRQPVGASWPTPAEGPGLPTAVEGQGTSAAAAAAATATATADVATTDGAACTTASATAPHPVPLTLAARHPGRRPSPPPPPPPTPPPPQPPPPPPSQPPPRPHNTPGCGLEVRKTSHGDRPRGRCVRVGYAQRGARVCRPPIPSGGGRVRAEREGGGGRAPCMYAPPMWEEPPPAGRGGGAAVGSNGRCGAW